MVAEQQTQLRPVIVPKQARIGQRGPVHARIVQSTIGDPAVEIEVPRIQHDTDERIEGIDRARRDACVAELVQSRLQSLDGGLIDRGNPGHRLVDVGGNLYIANAQPLERRDNVLVHETGPLSACEIV